MIRDLRRAFRRVVWMGDTPALDEERSLVVYVNHHNFYDGYLGWYVNQRVFGRRTLTWMQEWDAYPFFSVVGAMPFPVGDAARRAASVRHTARSLRSDPSVSFLYFPEGRLHPPEEGILDLPSPELRRLGRLFSGTQWMPVGLHVTWWGESRPTVLVGAGEPHDAPDGSETARLEQVLERLRRTPPRSGTVLLEGMRSPQETWNLSLFKPLFDRTGRW